MAPANDKAGTRRRTPGFWAGFLFGGFFAALINVSKLWRTSGQPDGPPLTGDQAMQVLVIALITGLLCGLVTFATKRLFPRRR